MAVDSSEELESRVDSVEEFDVELEAVEAVEAEVDSALVAAWAFGPSAGSSPCASCQAMPAPITRLTTTVSAEILRVSLAVEMRLRLYRRRMGDSLVRLGVMPPT